MHLTSKIIQTGKFVFSNQRDQNIILTTYNIKQYCSNFDLTRVRVRVSVSLQRLTWLTSQIKAQRITAMIRYLDTEQCVRILSTTL
jgi:hypothetical protein